MTPDRPISELFAQNRPLRSLEFFPPKDDAGVEALRATATALKRMNPDFVSVTYGAGGTTRDRTAQVCDFLKRDFGLASPRLAIAALNPHAGEDGRMGSEDQRVVAPAIAALRAGTKKKSYQT